MTNGTVKSSSRSGGMMASPSALTNGTVKKTASASRLVFTVDYGTGEKTNQVPACVPVVSLVPAGSSKLLLSSANPASGVH